MSSKFISDKVESEVLFMSKYHSEIEKKIQAYYVQLPFITATCYH